MFRRTDLAWGLVFAAVVSIAAAQQPGPPGGFGPPGGPRGGGGFGPGMQPVTAVGLLGMREVRDELALREDQNRPVDELVDESRQQMRDAFAGIDFQSLRDLSPEERDKRFAEMRKKGEEQGRALDAKLTKILDAKQSERLGQLKLQREGLAAFNHDDIATKLKLTSAQRDKLRGIAENAGPGFPPPSPEDQKKSLDEAVAVLTAAQRKTWTSLTGKEFAFPAGRGFGPGGFGGPGGPGGFGPGGGERKLVEKFDKDGDGRLNTEERKAARESNEGGGRRGGGRGPGGPGGGPGGFGGREPGKPGPKVSPSEVTSVPADVSLYAPNALRTLFLEFENPDWERELADFKGSDVEVPATLTIDGKRYENVGVHFRGASSFGMIPEGSKRSFNISLDFVDDEQRLYGYKTLNLLNANGDPSFLHSVLFSHIARQYIPAPKVNLVKVVVNGESWGVYDNAQQFDKVFLKENYPSSKGVRWKVPGRPGGRGGLEYIGDKVDDYKRLYEMKTDDGDKAWKDLINLCKVLNQTPADKLEKALEPILDVDGVLWFLALDNTLVNEDGYWTRASDYSLFRDDKGKFHVIPHDMNETFHSGGFGGPGGPGGPGGRGGFGGPGGGPRAEANGPGGRGPGPGGQPGREGPRDGGPREGGPREGGPREGGPREGGGRGEPGRGGPGGFGGPGGGGMRGGGAELDPLIGLNDSTKPLRSKLLAVPAFRTKYLHHVHTLATEWLDWNNLGPVVKQHAQLIDKEVEADTRKLSSYDAFKAAVSDAAPKEARPAEGQGRGRPESSLRSFVDARRKYLLAHPEVSKAGKSTTTSRR